MADILRPARRTASPHILPTTVGVIGALVLGCASPLFGRDGMFDVDGDRYGNVIDCDDFNPDVHPDAGESCDDASVDEDCDRRINDEDDDVQNPATWYRDADGDGFGGEETMLGCGPADGFVAEGGDCDDADPSVNPGTDEVCDEERKDEDCDGLADDDDDDATDGVEGFFDEDGDGFGDPARSASYCRLPDDWVEQGGDCDDVRAWINPDEDDVEADGFDQDCSGEDGPPLVLIPSGTFDMGCTAGQSDCDEDESPVMPVTLTKAYYIRVTEVTQAEYEAVTGATPSYNWNCGRDCPVEDVSWNDAAAFANDVSTSSGLTKCYTCSGSGASLSCTAAMSPYECDGYRLPTEAEWEGAARCGQDLLYSGSDEASDVAWYNANSDDDTHPVASLDPNACGLYDMSGNVYEWVSDWYDEEYYVTDGRTDPEGPASGTHRTIRGGSYTNTISLGRIRVSARSWNSQNQADIFGGFRLVRTAQ